MNGTLALRFSLASIVAVAAVGIVLSSGTLAPTIILIAVLVALGRLVPFSALDGRSPWLPLATLLTAVAVGWPGAPAVVLIAATILCTAWLSARRLSTVWIAGAYAFGLLAAVTQSIALDSPPEAVMSAFARAFILAAAVVIHRGDRAPSDDATQGARLLAYGYALVLSAFASMALGWPSRSISQSRLAGYTVAGNSIRPFGWASSPNEMGLIFALVAVASLTLWLIAPRRSAILAASLGGLAITGAIATGTRSALIALGIGVGLAIVLPLGRAKVRTRLVGLTVGGLAIAITVIALGVGGRDVLGRAGDGSAVYRGAVLQTMSSRLLSGAQGPLGVGIVNGNQLPPNPVTTGVEIADGSVFYLAAWLGLLGLALLAAILVAVFITGVIARSPAIPLLSAFTIVLAFENAIAWPSAVIVLIGLGGLLTHAVSSIHKQRTIHSLDRLDQSPTSSARGGQGRMERYLS